MSLGLGLGLGLGGRSKPSPVSRAPLLTVACGNSISAQSKFDATLKYKFSGMLHVANMLADAPMRFGLITPSTRSDLNATYGYSGQQLDTINSDIATQWIDPITTASLTPELVVGLALVENDIANGSSAANIQSRLTTWIGAVQTAWPTAKIVLCTPHPSFSYNTGGIVAVYQAVRDYMLSLDNARTIFVSRMDGYEDPANPALPLSGYTDATVHPNAKGAMVNARKLGATIRRIITPVLGTALSNNLTLTGTGAASGTNVSGTKPTNCTVPGSSNGTFVSAALQPGWRETVTRTAGGSTKTTDLSTSNAGAIAISGSPASISPYMKARIVSGASSIFTLGLEPRIQDGGGNTFRYNLLIESGDTTPGYQDGDVLTFVSPPKTPNSGAISQLQNYIRLYLADQDAPVVFEVIEQGYFLP